MISIIKFFVFIIVITSFVVWMSNNPGNVAITWNNYFVETNLLGLSLVIFSLIFIVFIVSFLSRSIKNIPRNFEFNRKEKNLQLTSKSLDNIAEGLLLGNYESIEKNSRILKKYLNNDFFSTFMLFNSALIKNNLNEALNYLKILETIPRADYISKRGKIIVLFKSGKIDETKSNLLKFCKDYPRDIWFHDKLSRIYALEKNWKLAHNQIYSIPKLPNELKNYLANLKVLSGQSPLDAYKLSSNSIEVVKETVKFFIKQNNLKKAIDLIEKGWLNFLCLELIETFMNYENNNEKETLKRYKLVFKALKKNINEKSNETKISLAYASYKASIWGEAQNYLDEIEKSLWDERVVELYKKISEKTDKVQPSSIKFNLVPKPGWKCLSCDYFSNHWDLICKNCSSIGTIFWTKSKGEVIQDNDFFKEFLQNPLRHLPKMKRKN